MDTFKKLFIPFAYFAKLALFCAQKKETSSFEDVPLCGILEEYRTFVEDFRKAADFCRKLDEY